MTEIKMVPMTSRVCDEPCVESDHQYIRTRVAGCRCIAIAVDGLGDVIFAGSDRAVLKVHQVLKSRDWTVDLEDE